MDIIYHSISAMWKKIKYVGYTVKEMTNFFKIRIEHLEFKEDKKEALAFSQTKSQREEAQQKKKQDDSDSNIIESSEKFSINFKPEVRK